MWNTATLFAQALDGPPHIAKHIHVAILLEFPRPGRGSFGAPRQQVFKKGTQKSGRPRGDPKKNRNSVKVKRGRQPGDSLNFVIFIVVKWCKLSTFCDICAVGLAAQCEIPPHIAQYPFEIVSQRGVSHPFALFSKGIAQVSLRYPFWGGVSHLHFACSPRGGNAQKREGVSHPIGHVETPETP